MIANFEKVKALLDQKLTIYNEPGFIDKDPILIPHSFSRKQDIEISGFFAATLAWGQRKTIISKCKDLMHKMDNAPYDFVIDHNEDDLRKLEGYVHRTFNDTDLLFFIEVLKDLYTQNSTMEDFFASAVSPTDLNIENGLNELHHFFFEREIFPHRSKKHLAAPFKKSACKRLNMFLRWMVRKDDRGVDFGIWEKIKPSQLVCPIDLHVERVSKELGLLSEKSKGWKAAIELTKNLKAFDSNDPIKYDIALFAMGIDRIY
ncbi:TIGR02757 family protein [Spirosomataceae bacterium TFI 002]|nr:TIGR02757 family protein [Spirosomataceae bacterium TFI 002]